MQRNDRSPFARLLKVPALFLVVLLLSQAVPASVGVPVHHFFGAFQCVGSDGSVRHASFGPIDRRVRHGADAPGLLGFAWALGGVATTTVSAVQLAGGGIQLDGLPRGTLTLDLTRPRPDLDDDFEPFVSISDQLGNAFHCGYNAP